MREHLSPRIHGCSTTSCRGPQGRSIQSLLVLTCHPGRHPEWRIAAKDPVTVYFTLSPRPSCRGRFTHENQNFGAIATGFKLYYYGSERFFVHGVWAGTLIAPNAKLVLGQTQNKKIYGQFLGKGVTVHQYSKVFRVPFNPKKSITPNTPLNVAWLGGRK